MTPDKHVAEGGDKDGGGGDPAHQLPQLVSVVQLTVSQLTTHLTPLQTSAVWNKLINKIALEDNDAIGIVKSLNL